MTKPRNTKRKVDLVSSHPENEEDEGPGLICDNEPTGLSVPHMSTESAPTLPFKLKPGEKLVEYYEYIPYVDHND